MRDDFFPSSTSLLLPAIPSVAPLPSPVIPANAAAPAFLPPAIRYLPDRRRAEASVGIRNTSAGVMFAAGVVVAAWRTTF